MAIEFKKTAYSGRVPEIWRGEAKILPAGFKPAQTLAVGTVVHRGTPVYVEFENRTAAICKTATVLDGGTTQKPRVAKESLFAVGDKLTNVGGTVLATVSGIDTENADYNVLNLSAAVTGLKAGDVLVEADTAGAAKYAPNAIVGSVLEVDGKGIPTIDVAYDAVVLTPSLSFPILADWLNGFCLKSNPNILFIKQ